jgi:hypothetical protein
MGSALGNPYLLEDKRGWNLIRGNKENAHSIEELAALARPGMANQNITLVTSASVPTDRL